MGKRYKVGFFCPHPFLRTLHQEMGMRAAGYHPVSLASPSFPGGWPWSQTLRKNNAQQHFPGWLSELVLIFFNYATWCLWMGTFRLLWVKAMFRSINSPNAAGQMLLIPLPLLLSNVWFSFKVFYLLPWRGPALLFWLSEDFAFTREPHTPAGSQPQGLHAGSSPHPSILTYVI